MSWDEDGGNARQSVTRVTCADPKRMLRAIDTTIVSHPRPIRPAPDTPIQSRQVLRVSAISGVACANVRPVCPGVANPARVIPSNPNL